MHDLMSRKLLPPRRALRALAASLALLAAQGCLRQQFKSLSELNALRQALVREYRHELVEINLNEAGDGLRVLGVMFINSPFNRLNEADRARKAQEIAAFARGRYAGVAGVSHIVVAFVRGESRFVVFQSRELVGYYPFPKNQILESEIAAAPPPGVGAAAKKPTASYSAFTRETVVSLNHLQIYGDLNDGLVLLPSFAVRGEKVTAPQSVDFEFVSYSKRRIFADDGRLSVAADGRELFARRGPRLATHGLGQDGTHAEVIKHRLSYQEFLRLAGAQSVKMKLGPKEFELTREHLRALRGLKDCVDAGACR